LLSQNEADYWEKFYIQFYKSDNPDFGYNLTKGGQLGHLHTEETKKKIGIASKNTWQNLPEDKKEEKKVFLKEINVKYIENSSFEERKNNTLKGRMASRVYWDSHKEEEKIKLDKMRINSVKTNSKPVYCIETKQEYSSSQTAARALGKTDGSHIRRSCRNKGETKGYGYHWLFIEDVENYLKKG